MQLRSHAWRAASRLRYRLCHQFLLIVVLLVLFMLLRAAKEGSWSLWNKDNLIAEENSDTVDATVAHPIVEDQPGKEQDGPQISATTDTGANTRHMLCRLRKPVNVSSSAGRGKTALVTGIAGFVGSHVATYCLQDLGLTVIGLDDLSSGVATNVPSGAEFIRGSFGDSNLLHRLFSSYRFDYVYHLAGHASETISHHVRSFTYENELVGSTKLLNAVLRAGGTKSFVYLSSTSVYADSTLDGGASKLHTEISDVAPMSPLSIAKLAFEHDLQAAHKSFGLSYTILRAHNLYGPLQNLQDPYHSVISSFIRQHLNQKRTQPVTIYGDGTQRRAFTYVTDVVPLICISPFVPAAENQVINVGSDELTTINELKRMVGEALGRPRPPTYVKSHAEAQSIDVDHTKMRCIFGYREMTGLRDGLSRLVPHVLASFSGKDNVQSILDVKHVKHVELADGLPVQSWEGHEVDVVHSMVLSEREEAELVTAEPFQ